MKKPELYRAVSFLSVRGQKSVLTDSPFFNMHPTGIEPTHMAPEAIALSTELRVQVVFYYN